MDKKEMTYLEALATSASRRSQEEIMESDLSRVRVCSNQGLGGLANISKHYCEHFE